MSGPGVGHKLPSSKVSWLKRDVLLFNLSIGCKAEETHYVYVRVNCLDETTRQGTNQ